MKNTVIATALIATFAGAVTVSAASSQSANPTTAVPVTWMPVGDVVAKLEAQGYEVLEIDREDGRYYEVEMRDANGFEVEAYVDAVTGTPLARGAGLDDDRDDDEHGESIDD